MTDTPVLDEAGHVVGIIGLSLDITERKHTEKRLRQSEEHYRAFITATSEAIWRLGLEQPIALSLSEDEQIEQLYRYSYLAECNDAMARMYGFGSSREMVGARLGDLLPPSDSASIDYLRILIRSDYNLDEVESREVDGQGQTKYFLNNLLGIIEDGTLQRSWGTQRDITDRKQTEALLRGSQKRLLLATESAYIGIWDWDVVANQLV